MLSNTSRKSVDYSGEPLVTIPGHEGMISGIAHIPGRNRFVTCSFDRTVRVWDVENGKQEGMSMEHEDEVYGLAVTRDGKQMISGGRDERMKVWDVETHELIKEWGIQTGGIWCVALSPDDRLVASGGGKGKIMIGEMKRAGENKHSIETGLSVNSICFSPTGDKLAFTANKHGGRGRGGNYTVQVYHVESGKLILGPINHKAWVNCVIWSLDASQLFSASSDRTIKCWNSKTAKPIGQPWTGHSDIVNFLSLSPDGRRLASTSPDGAIRFWDAHSGNSIEQPLQHKYSLLTVTFSPSGEFVASGGRDGEISIWRVPWWNVSQNVMIYYVHVSSSAISYCLVTAATQALPKRLYHHQAFRTLLTSSNVDPC
ncbi:hypothetical protein PAXRUDRAFT_165674 [Paxillus rubicundulus Ve08.2h10]|uniref:WD40 repeat-like protein n=1 Tax=Paxillus rubicundulus Ve08.2h10 TaxID=930991 RepID=A0A0D0DB37_9AGAM|nr:hypothetical protein PAXRUDRAFT_165674 [Paxillus rubicundulus Ve08.2h10]